MPNDDSTKELKSSLHWLADKWDARVKEVAGKGYRGGVYVTWDALGIVNIEFGIWRANEEIGAVNLSLGPLSDTHEDEYAYFYKEHPEEANLDSSFKHLGRFERELWAREFESLGDDFIYYSDVKEDILRIVKGKATVQERPHYGETNEYQKLVEFGAMQQGPYFGGN